MKILAVGDTHGETTPLEIAKSKINEVDKVIFLGDYVDSFDSDWCSKQKSTLEQIISFKESNPDKVFLLFGNHDLSYLSDPHVSGHQNIAHKSIHDFFKDNLDCFDVVHVQDSWIFSHAGVSSTWLSSVFQLSEKLDLFSFNMNRINDLFHKGKDDMFYFENFNHLSFNPYGDSPIEGPLWIRPNALLETLPNIANQCVGHTEFRDNVKRIFEKEERKFVFVDSQKRNYYAIIDTATDEVVIEHK